MACNVRIVILFWFILSIYVGACILYSNAFWFFLILLLYGEKKKVPLHVSIELMNRTGHCKFRLDCRTKKNANDGLLALPVHIPLDTVSVFPVSIPLEGLLLKVCVYPFLHLMTFNFRYQFLWRLCTAQCWILSIVF